MSPSFLRTTLFGLAVFLMTVAIGNTQGIPRPEHPRPDLKRDAWINLNGTWEFAETDDGNANYLETEMPDRITVPFCRESELSGLNRKGFVQYVWYRRSFEIPSEWKGKRVLFHVGACDWETTVWVNKQKVGFHRGSSDAFSFDITPFLEKGVNTVTLKVYDDVRTGLQPAGKQSQREESHGIFYTRTTGIWQTVWLEAVGTTHISDLSLVTDPDKYRLSIQARLDGEWFGGQLKAEAFMGEESVGKAQADTKWNVTEIDLPLAKRRLWTPSDPYLYTLRLTLLKEGQIVDELESYFGLRKVEVRGAAILINGEAIFQRLVLDQGFYPDGIWTAPTDEALKKDILLSQEAGFNGARLHQKVFEPRFLYHADCLGYLLWGEFPNFGLHFDQTAIDEPVIREWSQIVRRDRNHPSIIGWCPFNETPRESARVQNIVLDLTRQLDPTRPLLDTSGWTHTHDNPDVLDAHDYDQNPDSYRERWEAFFGANLALPRKYGLRTGAESGKPFFVSEFGGIGWNIEKGWGYGNTPESLDEFYARFKGLVDANLDNRHFFGYCYTQLTNVEQEQNGIFSFSREPKFDNARLKEIQSRKAAYETDPPTEVVPPPEIHWTVLVPSAHEREADLEWSYTEEDPGPDWMSADFDSSAWKKGRAGFGTRMDDLRGTEWKSKDIWLRKEFECDSIEFDIAAFVIFHDDDTQIFLNGNLVWQRGRWTDKYQGYEVTKAIRKNLVKGQNTIAVHTYQDAGGQYIDVGLLLGMKQR